MYTPLNWQHINVVEGTYIPSTRKTVNNMTFAFWERALFQRAMYSIKSDIPFEGSVKDFFYWCLFRRGYVAFYNDSDMGFSFQPCSLGGRTFYYQPKWAIVSNPYYKTSKKMEIGEECELLKLTPDFIGIWDIIYYYAEKLSELSLSIDMSIVNNRFAYLLGAKTKAAAQAIKKVWDKINAGETTIVFDQRIFNDEGEEPFQFLERTALKQNYLTTDQLQDFHTILNMFDREIGIPTVPYQKKERMVTDEANSTIVESISRLTIWIETLNESAKIIDDHFGSNLHFEARFKPDQGGDNNVTE